SVVRVNSSTPRSDGLRGANLSLGMKWSMGRPSLRPIPHRLIMRSSAHFYKSVLLLGVRNAQLIHSHEQQLAKITTTHCEGALELIGGVLEGGKERGLRGRLLAAQDRAI